MKKIILAIMITGLSITMAINASANLVAIGDPQLTGSWTQSFSMMGSSYFDRVDVFVDWGTYLKGGGLENISNNDWGGSISPDALLGSYHGGSTGNLLFDLHLSTDVPQPFGVSFRSYYHGTKMDNWYANWDGFGWDIASGNPPPAPVPEPSTLMLLGVGLVGVSGIWMKKFKHKPS